MGGTPELWYIRVSRYGGSTSLINAISNPEMGLSKI